MSRFRRSARAVQTVGRALKRVDEAVLCTQIHLAFAGGFFFSCGLSRSVPIKPQSSSAATKWHRYPDAAHPLSARLGSRKISETKKGMGVDQQERSQKLVQYYCCSKDKRWEMG